ncbi:MAG: outer membrane beta-barrel protein, partial [Smithellaceae bacterium]|nr:outer membrane beta-barrel protein [Smithellaceae bacterium]
MKTTTKCILAIVALAMMLPAGAFGDDFQLIPSLTVRGEYNDNIFGSANDEESDFITTVSPGLELIESTQRLDLRAAAKISPFFYADNSDWNDVDQNYKGNLGYRISELTRIHANAAYDVSNRPDRDLETTGLVYSNDRRDRQDYGLGFDHSLSVKTALGFSCVYFQ